jgi:hypothetical protein
MAASVLKTFPSMRAEARGAVENFASLPNLLKKKIFTFQIPAASDRAQTFGLLTALPDYAPCRNPLN